MAALRSRSRSAMETRVWTSRLRSTAQCRSSPLPLPIAGNFSRSLHAPILNRYCPPLYQLRSPPVSHFSSAKVLELSRVGEMMRGMGFREETVERLFDELPAAVLKDSDGFRKKIELLKCFFRLSLPEIDRILFDFPDYLMLGFEVRLKPLVDEIHRMDFSPAEIRAAVLEHPKPLLRSEPGELSRCIALVDNLKCRYVIKERILSKGYLRAAIDVKLRIECLREHGLIVRDALKVLHVEPRVILYDLQDIEEKIRFLVSNMGFCVEHLVECPEYLGVNLEKQIVPRHNVFEYLRSVGGLGDEVWMKHYVKLSRMKFYNMFVKPYPECERIFNSYSREKQTRPRHPVGMWKLFKPEKFEQSAEDDRNMREFMKSLR